MGSTCLGWKAFLGLGALPVKTREVSGKQGSRLSRYLCYWKLFSVGDWPRCGSRDARVVSPRLLLCFRACSPYSLSQTTVSHTHSQ